MQRNSNFHTASGSINWYNHFGKLALSFKIEPTHILLPVIPLLGIHPKEMCTHMHQRNVHIAKNWKTTQRSIVERTYL